MYENHQFQFLLKNHPSGLNTNFKMQITQHTVKFDEKSSNFMNKFKIKKKNQSHYFVCAKGVIQVWIMFLFNSANALTLSLNVLKF